MTFKEMIHFKLKKMGKDEEWLKKELDKCRHMVDRDFNFEEMDGTTMIFVASTLLLESRDFKMMNLTVIK